MQKKNHTDNLVRQGLLLSITVCSFLSIMIVTSSHAMVDGQKNNNGNKKGLAIEHPIHKPKMYSKTKRCPNCGMIINMWARTRHTFKHPEGDFTACSIRCVADKAVNSGVLPTAGQVAVYLDPDTIIPVEKAFYVVGSAAKGTMTMKSKIAFAEKQTAEKFAVDHGGNVVGFDKAFAAATKELSKSRKLIDKKRKKTGKIKEPTDRDTCIVCGMYPERYPKHNAQIWTKSGKTLHFCSTQCFVNFNVAPEKYAEKPVMIKMAWVTLFSDGMYESAYGPYYVVGSKVHGPMGHEALPFKFKKDAEKFANDNGGKILNFPQLTPAAVRGNGH